MFRITSQHMAAFEAQRLHDFETWMMGYLVRCNPERVALMTEEQLRKAVQHAYSMAAKYRIIRPTAVASFIQLQFEEGVDFVADKKRPWIAEILRNPVLDDIARVDMLWARLDDGYLIDEEDDAEEEEEEPVAIEEPAEAEADVQTGADEDEVADEEFIEDDD